MNWQPYRFEDVPTYTSSEALAQTNFARTMPSGITALRMRRAVGRAVSELQSRPDPAASASSTERRELDEWLQLHYVGPASRDTWHAGSANVRIEIGLGSRETRAVVEVPLGTVRSLIGEMVGVAPARLGASDLLTEVEAGILSFFIEQITSNVASHVDELESLLPFSILRCVCEQEDFAWGPLGVSGWHSVAGTVPLNQIPIPFRLLVPSSELATLRKRYESSPDFHIQQRRILERCIRPLGSLAVPMTGRLGVATLQPDVLEKLEPTDILLFERLGASFEASGKSESGENDTSETGNQQPLPAGQSPLQFEGTIELAHSGFEQEFGAIRGNIVLADEQDGNLRVRVTELLPPSRFSIEEATLSHEDKPTSDPETTATPSANDATAAAPGKALVEGTPVEVRIEMGRLTLSLRELSEVGPGHILKLQKRTNDPVSLVIGDRTIGRGELVQVDGELGVRVSSLEDS